MDKDFQQWTALSGREIKEGDFYLEDLDTTVEWEKELDEDGNAGWTYQLIAAGPVDDIFGTHVEVEEGEDYLLFFVSVSPAYDSLYEKMTVCLHSDTRAANGTQRYYVRHLNDAERKVLLRLVQQFEIARLKRQVEEG